MFFLQENAEKRHEGRRSEPSDSRPDQLSNDPAYIDVEKYIKDAWRYLRLKPKELRELTPREFVLMTEAESYFRYDVAEEQARQAFFIESAARVKKLKSIDDIYKRPTEDQTQQEENEPKKDTLKIQKDNEDFVKKLDLSKLQKGG